MGWHVADGDHPPLAGIDALGGAMADCVVEEQGIARFEVDLYRAFELFGGTDANPTPYTLHRVRKSDLWLPGITTVAPSPGPTSVNGASSESIKQAHWPFRRPLR